MKRTFLSIVLITFVSLIYADITGDGYYRVKNYGTGRWASLIDNKSDYVDFIAGQVDLHAMRLTLTTENILSDPASIVYVKNISGYKYDVSAQGVSLESLVENPIFIGKNGSADGQSLYRIWGTYQNVTKYISDGELLSKEEGTATVNDLSPSIKNWFFIPVNENTDNYFGAKPTLDLNGDLYCSLYTSFPYSSVNPEVKAYYVGRAAYGLAEMLEVTDFVPANTPVIIKCAGSSPSQNKMKIQTQTGSIAGNALTGVFFNYTGNTNNRVAYDSATMRVLGKCKDGSLGFVTANIGFIPANTVYLKVAPGAPAEFKCVSPAEYDQLLPAAVEKVETDAPVLTYYNQTVFSSGDIIIMNMDGRTVLQSSDGSADVSSLPKGVYVALSNGKSLKFIR